MNTGSYIVAGSVAVGGFTLTGGFVWGLCLAAARGDRQQATEPDTSNVVYLADHQRRLRLVDEAMGETDALIFSWPVRLIDQDHDFGGRAA